jgi:hypothetical protein
MTKNLRAMKLLDRDYLEDSIKKTYGLRLRVMIGSYTDSIFVAEINTKEGRAKIYSCNITKDQFLANIMRDFLFS